MYASLSFLFFGASRVYFLYASGCLLASLFLIQFFCVYLSKKKKKVEEELGLKGMAKSEYSQSKVKF